MSRFAIFNLICLGLAIIVGWSAGASHNDMLLKVSIILSLIFFAGTCISWDINHPPRAERGEQ